MKLARNVLSLIFVGLTCLGASVQGGEIKKDWTFQSQHGELLISASSFPTPSGGRTISLHVLPIKYGSWTVADEATSLSTVLVALPGAGFDIRNLSTIGLRFEEKGCPKTCGSTSGSVEDMANRFENKESG